MTAYTPLCKFDRIMYNGKNTEFEDAKEEDVALRQRPLLG